MMVPSHAALAHPRRRLVHRYPGVPKSVGDVKGATHVRRAHLTRKTPQPGTHIRQVGPR